jgi:hypothetical protein
MKTDVHDYVSARTRSKARLATNNTIMGKAHEEGGDLMSSEHLEAAFLTLGIADTSDDKVETEPVDENEPATYKAALRSPQATEWKEAMRQEWQALVENQTFDIVQRTKVGLQEKGQSGWMYSLQGTASHQRL